MGRDRTRGSAPFRVKLRGLPLDPHLPAPAGRIQSGFEGPAGFEGDPGPSRPSVRAARAHPHGSDSPPAGRSSLRMSRRCCVASSMSMLAQEEAMGPAAGALSAPRSFRCCRAQSSRATRAGARQPETGHYTPSTLQPTNRRPDHVPETLQPHQPPPLPARRLHGSRNLCGLKRKGSGLGADALSLREPISLHSPAPVPPGVRRVKQD